MKEKARQIMAENIEYYYDTKYGNPDPRDRFAAQEAMCAVKEAFIDLGVLTAEEIKAMRHEIHDRKKVEYEKA